MPPPKEPHLFIGDEINKLEKIELLKTFEIVKGEFRFECKFFEDRSNIGNISYRVEVYFKQVMGIVNFTQLQTKRKWMAYFLKECIGVNMKNDHMG